MKEKIRGKNKNKKLEREKNKWSFFFSYFLLFLKKKNKFFVNGDGGHQTPPPPPPPPPIFFVFTILRDLTFLLQVLSPYTCTYSHTNLLSHTSIFRRLFFHAYIHFDRIVRSLLHVYSISIDISNFQLIY